MGCGKVATGPREVNQNGIVCCPVSVRVWFLFSLFVSSGPVTAHLTRFADPRDSAIVKPRMANRVGTVFTCLLCRSCRASQEFRHNRAQQHLVEPRKSREQELTCPPIPCDFVSACPSAISVCSVHVIAHPRKRTTTTNRNQPQPQTTTTERENEIPSILVAVPHIGWS